MRIAVLSDVHGNLAALDLPTVAGNHERQLLTLPPEEMGASDRLAHGTLDEQQRSWLASPPATLEPAEGVLAFHGTPTDDLAYLLDTVEAAGARPATEAEVLDRLGPAADGSTWSLLLCGHTHLQRSVRLPLGEGRPHRGGPRPARRRPGAAHRPRLTPHARAGRPGPAMAARR
ncbi:hypothetical protein [Aquipuribacter hungaricus]|uniref:Calcineurin-like phosphoesterase domain-containing protein n=1 Tax=Aquipuribacter hungaricus TaxID=545624 RepID=A0ABV7WG62_9MICO